MTQSLAPTLQAHNDHLLTKLLLALPGAGARIYGGMYVPTNLADKWTEEKTRKHYHIADDAHRILADEGTPVVIILRLDAGNEYYRVADFAEVHTAWQTYGDIKTLYLIDSEFWDNHFSLNLQLIGDEDNLWPS